MVYLPPPTARGEGSSNRRSYNHAYNKILNAHRTNPLASASSVVLLVAPDVDALCAARMFASLFRQDDVMYQIKPVSGIAELEHVRDELMTSSEVRDSCVSFECQKLIAHYILAAHTYPAQYGRNSRPAIIRVVWRL